MVPTKLQKMSLFYDFTTATSSRASWTSSVLSFFASMKILTWLNRLWNESSGAGRVVSREKKACGRIIYGVYLADEIFLRQEELLQLNTLFSWKLCTGNWTHEAEEIKNKWKEEDDKEAIRCSRSPAAVALSCWSQTCPVWNQFSCQVPACCVTGTPECHQRAAQDTSKPAPLPCSTCFCCATEHPMFNNSLENNKKNNYLNRQLPVLK